MAAIIKQYQRTTDERAVAPVGVVAPQVDYKPLGDGLGAVGAALYDGQDIQDTGAAKAADARYSDLIRKELYDDETGFMHTQGSNAMGGHKSISERLEAAQHEALKGLTSGAAKKAQDIIRSRYQGALAKVDTHLAGQQRAFLDTASVARVNSLVQDAIYDPAIVSKAVVSATTEIADQGARNGWAPEVVKMKTDAEVTKIHAGIVARLDAVDPLQALEYLRENKAAMTGAEVARLEGVLVPKAREARGRQIGRSVALGLGSLPEGFDWSSHVKQGGTRADAITGMRKGFQSSLAHMITAAPADIKAGLQVFSGYRSDEKQAELWKAALQKYGSAAAARKWVAPPGSSEHGKGGAADIMWNGQRLDKAPDHVREWVHANAKTFGLHFPLSNEAWHVEQAGTRGTTPFVASGGGLADILLIDDPKERSAAFAEYKLFKGFEEQETKAAAAAVFTKAQEAILGGGSISDISKEDQLAMGPSAVSQLSAYGSALERDAAVETDVDFLQGLVTAQSKDPRAFSELDPTEWRDKLSDDDFRRLLSAHASEVSKFSAFDESRDLADQAQQITDIDAADDPDVLKAARTEYLFQESVKESNSEAARAKAAAAAFQAIESGSTIDSLPIAVRQSLGRDEMSALRSYQDKLLKGEQIVTDDAFYVQLTSLMATDPGAFKAQNPMAWRDKLDDANFQYFTKQRADLISGGRSDPSLSRMKTQADAAVKGLALSDPDPALNGRVLRHMMEWQAQNPDKAKDATEVFREANRAVASVEIDTWGRNKVVRALDVDFGGRTFSTDDDMDPIKFRDAMLGGNLIIAGQPIPADAADQIFADLSRVLNRPPTPDELLQALIAKVQ